ncbi:MAG: sigma-70 family RNA polymerase sigma factor [Deltaproteobacteria bacterium]|nr:sigma-70 family RNA polymerase sigma factor [Deltaproteobacteria bacterium]
MIIEAEIINGLKHNSQKAQKRFFVEMFNPLYAICFKILGRKSLANDIATDLLTDFIFKYVHQLSNPNGAWSYLRLMAVRRSIRAQNRNNKDVSYEEDTPGIVSTNISLSGVYFDNNTDAENRALMKILQEKLDKCLETLTPKAQASIRLKYTRELADEKIGQLIGCSKQYIGRQLKNSLVLLQKCLESGGVKI